MDCEAHSWKELSLDHVELLDYILNFVKPTMFAYSFVRTEFIFNDVLISRNFDILCVLSANSIPLLFHMLFQRLFLYPGNGIEFNGGDVSQ
jgi:hypothetical protein